MAVDPANAHELAEIASEVGAEVLEGALRYPFETGGWQLGDLDLAEYLDYYEQVVLIIAPIGGSRSGDPHLWRLWVRLQRARGGPAAR